MATDVQPSLGHGALFTQAGVPLGYDAIDLRRAVSIGCQEGAYAAGSYKVTQRGAGANLTVDIAASTHELGLGALVQGDAVSGQGLYPVPPHAAVINEAIAASDATNPRIDQVILELLDDTHDSSGNNKARVRVLTGTATAGATLDNRSGALALPSSAVRLADILRPASDASVNDSEIRDRRPWARGAYSLKVQESGADYSLGSGTNEIDATNIKKRVECSGVPVRMALRGSAFVVTSGDTFSIIPWVDGAAVSGSVGAEHRVMGTAAGAWVILNVEWVHIPSAASHTFSWAVKRVAGTGTFTIERGTDFPVESAVEEIVRQNASND